MAGSFYASLGSNIARPVRTRYGELESNDERTTCLLPLRVFDTSTQLSGSGSVYLCRENECRRLNHWIRMATVS